MPCTSFDGVTLFVISTLREILWPTLYEPLRMSLQHHPQRHLDDISIGYTLTSTDSAGYRGGSCVQMYRLDPCPAI
jgi:hypothetical protein